MFQYIRRAILSTNTTNIIKEYLINQVQYVEKVHKGAIDDLDSPIYIYSLKKGNQLYIGKTFDLPRDLKLKFKYNWQNKRVFGYKPDKWEFELLHQCWTYSDAYQMYNSEISSKHVTIGNDHHNLCSNTTCPVIACGKYDLKSLFWIKSPFWMDSKLVLNNYLALIHNLCIKAIPPRTRRRYCVISKSTFSSCLSLVIDDMKDQGAISREYFETKTTKQQFANMPGVVTRKAMVNKMITNAYVINEMALSKQNMTGINPVIADQLKSLIKHRW